MARTSPDPSEGAGVPTVAGGGGSTVPGEAGGGPRDDRRRALGRLVAIVVVVGLAVSFAVENLHRVALHLWVVRRTVDLDWVIGGCLVVGLAVGYWVGWQGHRRAQERRSTRRRRWRRR